MARVMSEQQWRQATTRSRCDRQGDRVVFTIPQRLVSPNTWGCERSIWRKAAERKNWVLRFSTAYLEAFRVYLLLSPRQQETRRMRVTVERQVPSVRNFIRDDDNLHGALKPLVDALRDLGLIRDDRREWLEASIPTQRVSNDGLDWTVITLEPAR